MWLLCLPVALGEPQPCTLLAGKLIKPQGKPLFRFNSSRRHSRTGYLMTHTQFYLQTSHGQIYKVIMDNLYYHHLSRAQADSSRNLGITAQLAHRYQVGAPVEACGKLYTGPAGEIGLKFVYFSACAEHPFQGFLRINSEDLTGDGGFYCANCAC